VAENLHNKLVLSLRSESQYSDFSPTKLFIKNSPKRHGPEKAADHWQQDHLQGQIHCHRWGIVSPSGLNLNPVMEECLLTSQGAAGDTHLPLTYEGQLKMFADMQEKMAKQHALFDREQEKAVID